jgi:hypothetical protein
MSTRSLSARFFINLSTGMLLIVMIASFGAIFKPHENFGDNSGAISVGDSFDDNDHGMSVGDLIGAEIGGTLGIMIRDDPPRQENDDASYHTIIAANHSNAEPKAGERTFAFLKGEMTEINS